LGGGVGIDPNLQSGLSKRILASRLKRDISYCSPGGVQRSRIGIIGANPTDGHPVFASRMKKRVRQGAKVIVVDPAASTW
jgi:hypothetical protein